MPTNTIPENSFAQTVGGSRIPATAEIDFAIDSGGPLTMILPTSSSAELWTLTGGLAPNVKWLGVYLVEADAASRIVCRLLAEGFRLRIDGKVLSC